MPYALRSAYVVDESTGSTGKISARRPRSIGAYVLPGEELRSEVVQRRERFGRFSTDLRHHIDVEERLLFPIFGEGEPSHRVLVDLMLDEHRQIEKALQAISLRLEAGLQSTEDLEFELLNVLWAHNAREEGSVYPWFDSNLSRDQAKRMNQELRTPRLGP